MVCNTGFKFDNQSTSTGFRTMSSSFYNPGSISCGSANNTFNLGILFLVFGALPQCTVSATNIVNPGTVDVGIDGLIKFSGQNVDLSRGSLISEGSGANAFGTGIASLLNTNYWDPSVFLGANYAESSFMPIAPFFLYLTNSTAYINTVQGVSNTIIRAVFIQDTSPSNVSYSVGYHVYFGTGGLGLGAGSATIEWTGSYLDPASGSYIKNYLYLNDDYIAGVATNNFLTGNGYPANFTFTASPAQIFLGTAPAPPDS